MEKVERSGLKDVRLGLEKKGEKGLGWNLLAEFMNKGHHKLF